MSNQDRPDDLKQFNARLSGRSSIVKGAKFQRGFVIVPEQILLLLHDTQPSLPIPVDAKFEGFGCDSAGRDSKIAFYFTSLLAPTEHCIELKPELFLNMLVDLAHGMLPSDSELDGIEISRVWTYILLRVKSSHWPAALGELLPLYHLRYFNQKLELTDVSKAAENTTRIRIN